VAVSSAKDISLPYLPWVLGHRNYKYPMSQGKCSLSCRHKLRKCNEVLKRDFLFDFDILMLTTDADQVLGIFINLTFCQFVIPSAYKNDQ